MQKKQHTAHVFTLVVILAASGCADPQQGSGAVGGKNQRSDALEQADATSGLMDVGYPDEDGARDKGGDVQPPQDAQPDALVPHDTAAVSDALMPADAPMSDASAVVDAGAVDSGPGGDATGGPGGLPCESHQFSYKPASGTQKVIVTGNWAGWNINGGTALVDDGTGTWRATLKLGGGAWQYKFVVDGSWVADPSNADQVDDGFGGKNSVLVLSKCPKKLGFTALKVDHEKGSFEAGFFATGGGLNASNVDVTVDWVPAPAGCKPNSSGGCDVKLSGLPKGIHDVRVSYDGYTALMKVYSGVSTDWRDAPMYFAMTDRFVNGDKTNDNKVGGLPASLDWMGGDFAGITAKIKSGYFGKLGIGSLWISWPAQQFAGAEPGGHIDQQGCGIDPKKANYKPTKYTAYHGYWPVSLDAVEPRFGTLKELQELVKEAHARGLRVLLDFTANHVHTASDLYKQKKDKGWFHLPAEVCQDIGWETKPVSCWFTKYLADFDYDNPATRNAVVESAVHWVKKSGADGFRLDAVKHIEMSFVEQLRAELDAEFAVTGVDFYIVGETFTGDASAIKSFVDDKRIHAQFDFPTNQQILKAFAKQELGLKQLDKFTRGIKGVYGKHSGWMSTFVGNHDIARFFSLANGDIKCGVWDIISNQAQGWKAPPPTGPSTSDLAYRKLLLAFVYAYSVPGIPLVYYGDEYGLPGAGDPDNRRMWSEPSGHAADLAAAMEVLGKLRAQLAPLRSGAWPESLWVDDSVLVMARTIGLAADRKAVVVALNRAGVERKGVADLGNAGVTKLKAGGACSRTVISKGATAQPCVVDANMKLSFTLAPRSATIYEIN